MNEREIEETARKAVAKVIRARGGVERDELLQAARIGVWRAAQRFEPARAAYERAREVYLYHGAYLAAQHAMDSVRKAQERLANDAGTEVIATAAGADEQLEAAEEAASLRRVFPELEELERYVLLRRLAGLSLAEVAAEAEMSKEGVRKVEARAVQQLRERLNPTVH